MGNGLRIAKAGYDANDVPEKSRVYDSNFNTFKYITYKVLRFTATDTAPKTYTVPHGLGYAPSTLCFTLASTPSYIDPLQPYGMVDSACDTGEQTVLCESNKTNVYVTVFSTTTPQDMDIIVLIGADNLADIGS